MKKVYCRFCAQLKPVEIVVNLESDDEKLREVFVKLSFLNAVYVVMINTNLPKFVCFECYESLNKAYDFLDKVKKAQDVLVNLQPEDEEKFPLNEYDCEPDGAFDDLCNSYDEIEKSEVKTDSEHCNVIVKVEPKEELTEETAKPQETDINCSTSDSINLNVQHLLEAALSKTNFGSDVKFIAKEVPPVPKKIKSWKNYPWCCSFCNIEFSDMDMLRTHSKTAHNKCATFLCADCRDFRSDAFEVFIAHVKQHQSSLRNLCHYCNIKIDSKTSDVHLEQHQTPYSCSACAETFEDQDSWHEHLNSYVTKPKRKPRRKAGTPITEKDRTCQTCNKVYKNLNSLRDHIKRHITDRKRNYTCERCGKMFFSKGTLTCHVMSHEKVHPHVCRICNKSFMFPNMLRRHVEMHSGVKPFSCEVCGRCFRLQYQLNAHKIIHTDSLPHVCQYCNKAFRFKQILKNHERQHTGAKPYNCSQCYLEFSNWSNYNKHMKRRHNIDTSKKKITPSGVFPVNPETGQIMQLEVQDMEEWKSKVMIPAKRGKKKAIKRETE